MFALTVDNAIHILSENNEMVSASEQARASFQSVSNGIETTNNLVQEIANSMAEQQEGSRQISEALSAMNNSTSEVNVPIQNNAFNVYP